MWPRSQARCSGRDADAKVWPPPPPPHPRDRRAPNAALLSSPRTPSGGTIWGFLAWNSRTQWRLVIRPQGGCSNQGEVRKMGSLWDPGRGVTWCWALKWSYWFPLEPSFWARSLAGSCILGPEPIWWEATEPQGMCSKTTSQSLWRCPRTPLGSRPQGQADLAPWATERGML